MTAAYLALMGGGVVLSMRLFADYQAPAVLAPMGLMLLGAAVMLSITIAGGVRLSTITNGIVAFGFYGIAFIAGWMEQILSMFGNSTARYVGTVVSLLSPSDAMWRRAAYEMQPLGDGRVSERAVRRRLGAERRDDRAGPCCSSSPCSPSPRGCSAAGRCDPRGRRRVTSPLSLPSRS